MSVLKAWIAVKGYFFSFTQVQLKMYVTQYSKRFNSAL